MSAVIEVGSGTQLRMSVRENRNPRPWLFGLPTAKVRAASLSLELLGITDQGYQDANLFKEAFIKAQQDNEALFTKDAVE